MSEFESLESLRGPIREGVINLLYRLADDDLILGHRLAGRTERAPTSEADAGLSSIAKDQMDRARAYYEMLHTLGELDPATLTLGRKSREFRCASLVCLAREDWAFAVLRQFLYSAGQTVRLSAMALSSLTPLANLAAKARGKEMGHMMQGRSWVLSAARSSDPNRRRVQSALDFAYSQAMGVFEPTEYDEMLARVGIVPGEEELLRHWESAVSPVLADAGLSVPESADPAYGGRVGRHPADLDELLDRVRGSHKAGMTYSP